MRSHYVFSGGKVVFAVENGRVTIDDQEPVSDPGYYVVSDCQPFISMIDGSIINSKSRYREHLKAHGCIEVGNDSSVLNPQRKPLQSPKGLKETIARQVYEKLRY